MTMESQEQSLLQALQSTSQLRECVRQTFEDLLRVPFSPSTVSRDAKQSRVRDPMLLQLRTNLTNVIKALSEIETSVSSLERLDSKTLTLGNSGLLSLDGESSSFAVYSKLLNGLEWSKKVKANAGLLAEALKTKRPREEEDKGADAKRLTVVDTMTQLADILPSLQSSHPDVQLHQTASPEGFPVLEITIGNAFGVSIGLSRLRIEQLVVRSLSEQQEHPSDIWTSSSSTVLQKLSEEAMAMALSLQLKYSSVDVLDSFLSWLRDRASNDPVQLGLLK